MRFRRQHIDREGINLTPLIDVVFLLLIFFMVSTTFSQQNHLQLILPEAAATESEPPQAIEIVIGADGAYTVAGRGLFDRQLESLKAALVQAAAGDFQQPLIITADARAEYQAVVRVMDAAGQLGFVNLSMTTRQPREEPQ